MSEQPIEWIEREIMIRYDDNGVERLAPVQNQVAGELAVGPDHPDEPEYWLITHVPTGMRVWWGFDRDLVFATAEKLLGCGVDWNSIDRAGFTPATPGYDAMMDIILAARFEIIVSVSVAEGAPCSNESIN